MPSDAGKGKEKAVERFSRSPSPQQDHEEVQHGDTDAGQYGAADFVRQQQERENYHHYYGHTSHYADLMQAGNSSHQEHGFSFVQETPEKEKKKNKSSSATSRSRFLPTGQDIAVGGWRAYTNAHRSTTNAEPRTDSPYDRMNEKDGNLCREYGRLHAAGRLEKITQEHRAAIRKFSAISKHSNPDRVARDTNKKVDNRRIAHNMRVYLKERIEITIKSSEGKKTFQTPNAVYDRAYQEEGYRQDKETLIRKAQRYAKDHKNYYSTDEE